MFSRRSTAEAVQTAALAEVNANLEAINAVVIALASTTTAEEAVSTALSTVRRCFGWVYGSYWRISADGKHLRFDQESGDAGEEFRRVTQEASFAEGVGLSGRAWRRRELVFVADLGTLTDCVRAPAPPRPSGPACARACASPSTRTAPSSAPWTSSPPRH
ncbi:GAF domain-containing protein [Actinotalea sp. C106]|uniref:GAF domain-containing protein n=1 Tax=Actinotalea sp. C106 TaxID=2908644 RepID=UPI002027A2BA|nr:GAF domain-containing protein [Actinotalea sp. C106]